jgi:hypothetical protein
MPKGDKCPTLEVNFDRVYFALLNVNMFFLQMRRKLQNDGL